MKKKICPKCGYENKRDAAYCGLCYEPFNKKTAPAEPPHDRALPPGFPAHTAPAAPLPPLLKAAFLLLGLALAAFLIPSLPAVKEVISARAAAENRYKDKSEAADKLLADYVAAKESLLAEIAAAPPDPEAFGLAGSYTTKLFGIEETYEATVESLMLPAESSLDAEKDAAYLEWLEDRRQREEAAMNDFSVKYQREIQRSGAAAGN